MWSKGGKHENLLDPSSISKESADKTSDVSSNTNNTKTDVDFEKTNASFEKAEQKALEIEKSKSVLAVV